MITQKKAIIIFWMIMLMIAVLLIFNLKIMSLGKTFNADCKQTYTNHSLCDCVDPIQNNYLNLTEKIIINQNETKNIK